MEKHVNDGRMSPISAATLFWRSNLVSNCILASPTLRSPRLLFDDSLWSDNVGGESPRTTKQRNTTGD